MKLYLFVPLFYLQILVTIKKTLYYRSYQDHNIWFYYFVLNLVAKNKSYWNNFLKTIFLNINLTIHYSYINARLYCTYNMLIKIKNVVLKIILWNWISSTNPKTALQKHLPFIFSYEDSLFISKLRVEGVWGCIRVWQSLTYDYCYGYLIVHNESWCCCIPRWSITWG